ncbi:class I SAM-dependent methyltransferase, partial [Patescibacteria group bacterium]|nr:class I SAM-dependent methyltransferase [Patescibacteria group bacterium]
MKLREWIADNVGYRFGGCCYNYFSSHKQLFDFIEAKIPDDFLGREISDLGCGDGQNTFKIKKIFKPKKITGYERNDFLIRRAEQRGLKVKKVDLNKKVPSGEMVVSTFALHHLHDKEETLRQIVKNF